MERTLITVAACIIAITPACEQSPRSAAPPAVKADVGTPAEAIVGWAVRDSTGAWCVATMRGDIRPGWQLRIFWPDEFQMSAAVLGEPRGACQPDDALPGERAFNVKLSDKVSPEKPGVVTGELSWQGSQSTGYTANLDNLPGDDRITFCTDYESYHLLVVSDSGPNRRISWHHEIPLQTYEQPTCEDDVRRIALYKLPVRPVLLPVWAYRDLRVSPKMTWLLLVTDSLGANLRTTAVGQVKSEEPCGEDESVITTRLGPSPEVPHLALLGSIPQLRAGPVSNAYFLDDYRPDSQSDPDSVRLVVRSDSMILRRQRAPDLLEVIAQTGGRLYTLFHSDREDEGRWNVEWAGDLDHDGRLDLLLFATNKYSVYGVQLHLSHMRSLDAWPAVAEYSQAGC